MPADHKVSVAWQIGFTFLPIVNFWAFYRIRKLRKYVLYVILPEIGISLIAFAYLAYSNAKLQADLEGQFSYMHSYWFLPDFNTTLAINSLSIAFQGLAIYLVIIWSRQHNRAFDSPS